MISLPLAITMALTFLSPFPAMTLISTLAIDPRVRVRAGNMDESWYSNLNSMGSGWFRVKVRVGVKGGDRSVAVDRDMDGMAVGGIL